MRGFRFQSVLDIAALAFGRRCAGVKPTPRHSAAHERYPMYEIERNGKTAYPAQFSAKLVSTKATVRLYMCKFSIPKFLWEMHLLIANLSALSYEMKIACLKSQIFNESILHAQYVGVSAPAIFFPLESSYSHEIRKLEQWRRRRKFSCRKRSLPVLKQLENFWPVVECFC